MKIRECGRESEVLRAVRTGGLEAQPALQAHVDTCVDCARTVKLAAAFRQDAAQLVGVATVPDVARVWRRAEQRRKEMALARAATIFRVLRVAGVIYGLAVAMWLLHVLPAWMGSGMATVSTSELIPVHAPHLEPSMLGYMLGGLAAVVACVGSGLWMALREDAALQ
ncbi:hypothetical protein [Silvibacterium dinghuense]|uniref:Zinc-finger domain-containing protein n=1 Tax=Silvibacterium dinghuense TaxID=1560006 RepID=A0A4Q1SEF1_9BACT|nr:hypothetical protein [Silvibacterium dinghuense]RXS95308.1 hypothetical protein ESZ00_12015 [Silvibacterium dinghuense]GGH12298.1 hypothetical protein GCM10011586_31470 [Silvibacterium dinghuense]